MKRNIVIAIDGPAGVGKSTTARRVAHELGVAYVDSGAFYRVCTLQLLRSGVELTDEDAVSDLLHSTRITASTDKDGAHIHLDGEDVTQEIRSHDVTENVSKISELGSVRDHVTRRLRALAANGSVVIEGRDIGTAVFPNADLKVFLAAGVDERARRRHLELGQAGVESDFKAIRESIEKRDARDAAREFAPLRQADDAILVDSTDLDTDQVVEFIVNKANAILSIKSSSAPKIL